MGNGTSITGSTSGANGNVTMGADAGRGKAARKAKGVALR